MIPVSFLEQVVKLGQLLFSSPVYFGLFWIFFLLFLFQILNVKRQKIWVKVMIAVLFLGFLTFTILGYHSDILTGFDAMMERLIFNLYFPSLAIYILVLAFSYLLFIYTLFRKTFSSLVQKINITFFTLLQFLFSIFLITVITNSIDISSRISMYQSSTLVTVLQFSMILFVFWLLALGIVYYIKQVKKYLSSDSV